MKEKLSINPEMLKWAREKASMSLEDASFLAKIPVQKATKKKPLVTPKEKLNSWEMGSDTPSLGQLKKLAGVYQRPLMTFFLQKKPRTENTLLDYRTVGSMPHTQDSPTFSKLKRRLINLQKGLSDIVQGQGIPPLNLVGIADLDNDLDELIEKVRIKLNLTIKEQCKARNEDDLFRIIRERIQQLGIYVVMEGDLGSYQTAISPDEFRGLTISDKYAPLIVINPKDLKTAKLFSLLHEFCHILLNESSISNVSMNDYKIGPNETFCNKFAAEFLLPQKELQQKISIINCANKTHEIMSLLQDLSKVYKVSLMVVARRLYDLKKISYDTYTTIAALINKNYKRSRKENVIVSKNKLDKYRLGSTLYTVVDAAENGNISIMDASQMLNLNYTRFSKVLSA